MAEHVGVDAKRKPSSLTSPFNHASDAHAAEGLTTPVDEHVRRLAPVSLLLPLQQLETVHLVTFKEMNAIGAALQAANDNGALGQVDIIPAKIASLGYAKTMTIDNERQEPIPVTMPVTLESGEELVDLGLGQMLAGAIGCIRLSTLHWSHYAIFGLSEPNDVCWHFRHPQISIGRIMAYKAT
jgi:hypothetical protein